MTIDLSRVKDLLDLYIVINLLTALTQTHTRTLLLVVNELIVIKLNLDNRNDRSDVYERMLADNFRFVSSPRVSRLRVRSTPMC